MNHPPQLRDLAGRLTANEMKLSKSSGTKIPAACLASEKLRPHLAALMGNMGFRALLARALALATEDVPWLRAVQVKPDGSFEGFEDLGTQVDPEELFNGCAVLLSHLLGLLVAFIGEELTLQLVRQAWPELSSNNFDLDEGGA
jgi:hypothetical protein